MAYFIKRVGSHSQTSCRAGEVPRRALTFSGNFRMMSRAGITAFGVGILLWTTVFAAQAGAAEKWKEYKSRHFIIYYQEAPRDFVETIEDAAEEYYRSIARDLGFTRYEGWAWDDRAKIYIYNDADHYVTDSRGAGWSSGHANTRDKIIRTFPSAVGFFDTTLPHELGHIIFREFIGPHVQLPLWLEEGVAMYQEKAKRWGSHKIVREAMENGTFLTLPQLNSIRLTHATPQDAVALYYMESASVVNFMITEYGQSRFVRFCRKLQQGRRFLSALSSVYIRFDDLEDLNKYWVRYLEKQ